MTESQPSLFYTENYEQLIASLESAKELSMQESHNLAITKFLKNGENPLPVLQSFVDQIGTETDGTSTWPIHPSWNFLLYHIALYNFCVGNVKECITTLDNLFNHQDNIDVVVMACMSLLGIELFIRFNEDQFLERSQNYLKVHFPTPESVKEALSSKISDEKFLNKMVESIQFADLRVQVSKAQKLPPDEAKAIFEKIVESSNISQDTKNRVLLPLKQVIPIANAALLIGDQRYIPILESADDQSHFALFNNRGIFELTQKRYSSALLYFSKALNSRKNNTITHPYQQIIYNIGLSLLMKKKPKKAFRFLHSVIPFMSKSPYLWLRLGECCVMHYKQRVAKLRKEKQYSPVIGKKLCTKTHSFIILPQTDYKLYESYPLTGEGVISDLNLNFAEKCTRNAISLCGDKYPQICQNAKLLNSFISLELGDGRRASEMGKSVYTSGNIDQQHQFLAKIYDAQGHYLMGDSTEARGILSRLMIESNIRSEEEKFAAYSITFTHVCIASNDIKKAQDQLKKATEADVSCNRPEVVLTKVALDLRNHKIKQAIATLNSFNSNN